MDRLTLFRQSLRKIVEDYRSYLPKPENKNENADEEVEILTICDDENGQYALFEVGWHYPHRVYKPLFHARIKDRKVWVEQDWTKHGIVNDLLDAGIRPNEIEQGNITPMLRVSSDLAAMR